LPCGHVTSKHLIYFTILLEKRLRSQQELQEIWDIEIYRTALEWGVNDNKHIVEFIIAWEAEFGEYLSEDEARTRLDELVELYHLVARPLPPKENDTPPTA